MLRKQLLCVQASTLLLLFLLWLLPDLQLPQLFQTPPQPPHATYRRTCYKYHRNLTAENTCCKMTNFSGALDLLHTCIRRANTRLLNEAKGKTGGAEEKTDANATEKTGGGAEGATNGDVAGSGNWPSIKGVHWVLIGDSHVRYIMGSLITRFRSPGLKFRKTHSEKWQDTAEIEKILRHNVLQRRVHVLDRNISFRMTFIWDSLLTVLPAEMAFWERRPHETPSLLIFASALHWMVRTQNLYAKNGTEVAAAKYREHIRSLRPQLTRLSNRTTVVFKLLDDLKRTNISNSTEPLFSYSNYVRYNEIAVQELARTGVVIWDSTRPLSTGYASECIKNPNKQTPPYFYWKCQDLGHVGYILVDQYADMIINDFCNKHLHIPGTCL